MAQISRSAARGALFLTTLVLLLAACAAPAGDPARGAQLFGGATPFSNPEALACNTCHSVNAADGPGLGPNLAGLAGVAASRVPDQSAEEYLRQSLIATDAYLSEGYQEGIMPRNYNTTLTDQDMRDLIAYMLTLN